MEVKTKLIYFCVLEVIPLSHIQSFISYCSHKTPKHRQYGVLGLCQNLVEPLKDNVYNYSEASAGNSPSLEIIISPIVHFTFYMTLISDGELFELFDHLPVSTSVGRSAFKRLNIISTIL